MKDIEENEQNQGYLINSLFDVYFQKFTKMEEILYEPDNLIDNVDKKDFTCSICLFVLKDPINCSDKTNSHSFCEKCINEYLKEKYNCPYCKSVFEYKINSEKINKLNKLSFKCPFNQKGCDDIIPYNNYPNHLSKCIYNKNDVKYRCNIGKYNYNLKEFKKCDYINSKNGIKKHFTSCEHILYNCLFCNKYILLMNLEEHAKMECKMRVIKFPDNNYIGEMKNNLKDGYGTEYLIDGDLYSGEFKKGLRVGYGKKYTI